MTIDINEKNITYSIFDNNGNVIKTVRLDIYKVKRIHDEEKRFRGNLLKSHKKWEKYWKSIMVEKKEDLHKVSAIIISEALKYNTKKSLWKT